MLRVLVVSKNSIVFLLLLLLLACEQKEQLTIQRVPNPQQSSGGYVSNPDQILTEDAVVKINGLLSSLDQSGKAQVNVVVLKSIGEQVPKDFAVELFNYWGIGAKETDNGLLILVVADQHRIEFETGYGLEGDLTDLTCFRIQQDYMIPFAKENKFDVALINGVNAVNDKLNSISSTDEVVTETLPEETTQENFISEPVVASFSFNAFVVIANSIFSLLFLSVITLAMLGGDFQQGKKIKEVAATTLFRSAWYKSFWFTALFIILGALVMMDIFSFVFQHADFPFYVSIIAFYISWCVFVHVYYFIILPVKMAQSPLSTPHLQHEQRAEANKYLKRFSWVFPLPFLLLFSLWNQSRLRKLRNTLLTCDCGTVMKRKSEVEDDLFLTNVQVKEERVKSIDYDVWVCSACQKQRVLPYQDFTSAILQCDKCSGRTMLKTGSKVVEQASYSSGGYGYKIYDCQNCAHQTKVKFTIPKKTQSSSSSGSSGGSSSSSSSGGGSSGGGGSGSSW